MCKFCEITDCVLSGGYKTSTQRIAFADLRFDEENSQLDINFGLLDDNGYQGKDATWSDSLDINYCPVCGRKLRD